MIRIRAHAAVAAVTLLGGALVATAAPASARPASLATTADPAAAAAAQRASDAALLRLVPAKDRSSVRIAHDGAAPAGGPAQTNVTTGLVDYRAASNLRVYDLRTTSLYRVSDYVANLSLHTNFGGSYVFTNVEPDPCPSSQNCAVINSLNQGATGKRVSWAYALDATGRAVAGQAVINLYYPTDAHYADVEVCAAVSHVAGLNYTRGPSVARSCLDTEPYNSGTSNYWTGADWDYVNQLWLTNGVSAP